MDGFYDHGSSREKSFAGSQGKVLGEYLNILNPNLTYEWATLSWLAPSAFPIGQTSDRAEGPSGWGFISYQNA